MGSVRLAVRIYLSFYTNHLGTRNQVCGDALYGCLNEILAACERDICRELALGH